MKAHDGMYIGGKWRPASGADTIAVVNPADEQVIAHVPAGTAEDVDAAVRAARAAFPGWSATPPAERAARIAALRDVLVARQDEIAATVTAELGAPLPLSQAVHAGVPILVAGSYAELAASYPFEEKHGNSTVLLEPVGVVGAITPWNYPLHQIVAKVAPALAAGCTIVLKPAEDTPLTAQLFAEATAEAACPPVSSTWSPAAARSPDRPSPRTRTSTWSRSPDPPPSGSRSAPPRAARSSASRWSSAASPPTSSCPRPIWPRPSTSASPT